MANFIRCSHIAENEYLIYELFRNENLSTLRFECGEN